MTRTYTITGVRTTNGKLAVAYTDGGDPAADPECSQETHLPSTRISAFMAEYGITDPADALDQVLHAFHVHRYLETLDPRDDPAVVQGWVTTETPDAEPVHLFNARSTTDAAGAHRARTDATKAAHSVITDPGGLLAPLHAAPVDTALIEMHRQRVDITRWELVYGGLPVDPPPRRAIAAPPTLEG